MKILKFIYSLSLVLTFNVVSFANPNFEADTIKTHLPSVGQKSFLISINPLISFVGNMFNGNSYNALNLSSGSILYRKYKEKNVSKRYRVNFQIFSNSIIGNQSVNLSELARGTERINAFSLSFAFGKEKRFRMNNFSLYGGWEFFSGINHNSNTWHYDYNKGDKVNTQFSDFSASRLKSYDVSNQLQVGVGGLLGIDYHFSKMFYVNMEMSIPFQVSAELISQTKYENLIIKDYRVVDASIEDTEKPTLLWDVYINSSQLLQFRAGVVF